LARRSRRSVLEDLMDLPWWVSVAVAAIIYGLLRFAVPAYSSGHALAGALAQAAAQHAWLFGGLFLIPAPIAAFRQYRRKKLFDAQADLASIRGLSWQEFEKLIAEWFHRIGYTVSEQGGSSADGGIDLIATGPHEKILVQCKHWRDRMVGVAIVRELYGVMTAEAASGGALVTSGSFSDDAIAFAAGKSIQLIDGRKLEQLVLSIKNTHDAQATSSTAATEPSMSCPTCGAPMVMRLAKQGARAGSRFWGCTRFPACRGIRQLA
jgi:restriction system protein